ncbi:MAG: helical backbone metal receptor [Bacteroidia bacterium]|nr:helical backbone metal receptor [Bacteroidia bacterium]
MKRFFFLCLLSPLLIAGCTSSEKKSLVENAPLISQTFTDNLGRTIQLPHKPERVVSIAPNITEIIFAVGGQEKLVGRSQACDYPPEVENFVEIITYPELDLEGVKATNPDLIVTTDEIFTPDQITRMERLGLPIFIQSYQTFSDVYKGIREIGNLFDQPATASVLADSLLRLEQKIIDSTENLIKYRTLILISTEPLKVVGGKGFLNEMIQKAGGLNVFGEKAAAYYTTTPEEILKAQPEFIIIPAVHQQAYAELLALYPTLYNTPADVQKQVHIVNPDLFYRPGPRMLEGLLSLTHILHTSLNPQKFRDAQ